MALQRLRQTEVQDFYRAVGFDLSVCGFPITVDDVLFVRRLEGVGDLASNR